MRIAIQYSPAAPAAYRTPRLGIAVPGDLRVVCLWSTIGCALTGLWFALGYGVEIGQVLAVAG